MSPIRLWGLALVAAVAGVLSSAPASAAERRLDLSAYSERFMATLPDGRRMRLVCLGQGGPTVVLEAGLALPSFTWRWVIADAAQTARVCAYDRAGFGFSDPGPMPRDPKALASDLAALVDAGGLEGPLILVGQSMGALPALLYTQAHRDRVAGVILLDPAINGERLKRYSASGYAKIAAADAAMRTCATDVVEGRVPNVEALDPACGARWIKPGYAGRLADRQESDNLDRNAARAALSELAEVEKSAPFEQVLKSSLGALPLMVLTASDTLVTATFGLTDAEREALDGARIAMHEEYRALSTVGERRVVPGAGHAIHLEKPEVVSAAITEMVQAVRAANSP